MNSLGLNKSLKRSKPKRQVTWGITSKKESRIRKSYSCVEKMKVPMYPDNRTIGENTGKISWIKHFFNIIEEDLK